MSFWDRLFGAPAEKAPEKRTVTWPPRVKPTAEQSQGTGSAPAPSARQIDAVVSTLSRAGLTPKRELTSEDFAAPARAGTFDTRPLTSAPLLLDRDDQPLFSGVYLIDDSRPLTTPEGLQAFAEDLAAAAGTAQGLRVVIVADPGSGTRGSLSVHTGRSVRDVSFDLDPEAGDEFAEAQLPAAVSPETRIAHTLTAGPGGERVVVWVSRRGPVRVRQALEAENPWQK